MKRPIKIVVDSTCDLSLQETKDLDLILMPMTITIKEKNYLDIYDINPAKMFEICEMENEYPKTSSITVGTMYTLFDKLVKEGNDIIYLGLSSKLSSNFEHAVTISEDYSGRIKVIDTLNLSSSIVILVKHALRLIKEGKTIEEISYELRHIRTNIECMFVIKDLSYIRHGGRISKIEYYASKFLKINPIIEVKNGYLTDSYHVFGKIKRAQIKMLNIVKNDYLKSGIVDDTIYLTDCLYPSCKKYFKEELLKINPNFKIIEGYCGCVIATHSGKNCCGIAYERKENDAK